MVFLRARSDPTAPACIPARASYPRSATTVENIQESRILIGPEARVNGLCDWVVVLTYLIVYEGRIPASGKPTLLSSILLVFNHFSKENDVETPGFPGILAFLLTPVAPGNPSARVSTGVKSGQLGLVVLAASHRRSIV
jgi:hypothetical protein